MPENYKLIFESWLRAEFSFLGSTYGADLTNKNFFDTLEKACLSPNLSAIGISYSIPYLNVDGKIGEQYYTCYFKVGEELSLKQFVQLVKERGDTFKFEFERGFDVDKLQADTVCISKASLQDGTKDIMMVTKDTNVYDSVEKMAIAVKNFIASYQSTIQHLGTLSATEEPEIQR